MLLSNEDTIATIVRLHRERIFVQNQRKRMDNAAGAYVRYVLGWKKDLPKAEAERIKAEANALIENAEIDFILTKEEHDGERARIQKKTRDKFDPDLPHYGEFRAALIATIEARGSFDRIETRCTADMETLAMSLPVWQWAKDVAGFGARSLATIIGDAGDLSRYPTKGHLWKRMGVAVIGGGAGIADIAQGKLPKSASKDDWIAHGYSRMKRSHLFVIGDVMIKGGAYRPVFLARCAYEHARAVSEGKTVVSATASVIETWAGRGLVVHKVTEKKFNAATMVAAGHLHNRARRYMEKMLLRDLLREWKAAQRANELAPSKAVPLMPDERPRLEAAE